MTFCCLHQESVETDNKKPNSTSSSEVSETNLSVQSDSENEEKKLLNEKIEKLESELAEMKNSFNCQKDSNALVLQDFYKFKLECESQISVLSKALSDRDIESDSKTQQQNQKKISFSSSCHSFDDKCSQNTLNVILEDDENSVNNESSKEKSSISSHSSIKSSASSESQISSENFLKDRLQTDHLNLKHDDEEYSNCNYCEGDGNESKFFNHFGDIENNFQTLHCCIQNIFKELSIRPKRRELEICKEQIWKLMEVVSKLRQSEKATSGIVLPLIENQFLSYTTSLNTSPYSFPKMPPLKYARQNVNQNLRRGTCGSHTKILRSNQIKNMRYKRIKTPVKICSSLLICKNRFRS